jgi:DNA polymerase-3 subunit epsilon/ATP-dependent DNA helicase DinG
MLATEAQSAPDRSREYGTRIRITDGVRHSPGWQTIEQEWDSAALALAWIRSGLTGLQELVETIAEPDALGDNEANTAALLQIEDLVNRIGTVGRKVGEALYLLGAAIHNPVPDQVFWIESRNDGRDVSINAAPLQLAGYLRQHLFGRLDSLILTSATMSTGASFAFVKQRLGLPDADELAFSSPFDFRLNALLVVPTDLPEPNEAGFAAASHRAILETAQAAGGRTLVLFTSIQAMNAARAALSDRLRGAGLYLVTQHEDGSAEQLAERLRSFDDTVVFGAGAFWEGVDIPGPALSALVIAKLPFAVPTDPIIAARSETFDNPFMEYSVPQAILRFRQGFGRLIRSQSDRGVCVALDRRLISKRYGRLILDAIPDAQRQFPELDDLGEIVHGFLEQKSESR